MPKKQKNPTTSKAAAKLAAAHRKEVRAAQRRVEQWEREQEEFQVRLKEKMREALRQLKEDAPTASPTARLQHARRSQAENINPALQHQRDLRLLARHREQLEKDAAKSGKR